MRQETKPQIEARLRGLALSGTGRSGAGESDPRSRRAASADVSTGLRLGDGVKVKDGKLDVVTGDGLEVDKDGKIASSAKTDIFLAHLPQYTLTATFDPLTLAGATVSSFGVGRISVDEDNKWFKLEPKAAYLIEVIAILHRAMGASTTTTDTATIRLEQMGFLDAAVPTASVLLTAAPIILLSAGSAHPQVAVPMKAIIDLSKDDFAGGLRISAKMVVGGGSDTSYVEFTSVKIARVG